ncbi:TetR family transcriptional regulator [Acrocarpospora pleiomorpha]|uniref:TetR family transcriptional regulator n=1 Tax=Acrocarpospora pleiomorpha TaxID=90975 RepID=A0A5M3XAC5_9ACTN|nr:TetR/AcrR family transcriptional regulator [Acrocarpospora pleiomorpha]GES18657.1 TetR family transcriptional regulator [Acrocarpospora pleiomorpha]
MTGLRERKKEQTRRRIAEVAMRLFAERGYDAVTVNEIAAAAEVAKVTLFKYFPTKESLVLEGVAEEDLARIVSSRPPGQSPLTALRAYYRASATTTPDHLTRVGDPGQDGCQDEALSERHERAREELIIRMRVIFDNPALSAAASELLYRQREDLAAVLANDHDELTAALMAAQIAASILTIQETFYRRLLAGASLADAGRKLGSDVELAFDLLEHGYRKDDQHARPGDQL